MAKIFENRSEDYDGSGSITAGTGVILVYFYSNIPNISTLTLLSRKTGTNDPFVPLRVEKESKIYKADVTGMDYYFKWVIPNPTDKIRGTLDV